jgi:hypothetical protein
MFPQYYNNIIIKTKQKKTKDSTSLLLEWLSLRTQTTNVGEDVGKKEPSYTAGGNAN